MPLTTVSLSTSGAFSSLDNSAAVGVIIAAERNRTRYATGRAAGRELMCAACTSVAACERTAMRVHGRSARNGVAPRDNGRLHRTDPSRDAHGLGGSAHPSRHDPPRPTPSGRPLFWFPTARTPTRSRFCPDPPVRAVAASARGRAVSDALPGAAPCARRADPTPGARERGFSRAGGSLLNASWERPAQACRTLSSVKASRLRGARCPGQRAGLVVGGRTPLRGHEGWQRQAAPARRGAACARVRVRTAPQHTPRCVSSRENAAQRRSAAGGAGARDHGTPRACGYARRDRGIEGVGKGAARARAPSARLAHRADAQTRAPGWHGAT